MYVLYFNSKVASQVLERSKKDQPILPVGRRRHTVWGHPEPTKGLDPRGRTWYTSGQEAGRNGADLEECAGPGNNNTLVDKMFL